MKYSRFTFAAGSAVVALAILVILNAELLASAFARNPFPKSAQSASRGRLLFQKYCTVCHGPEGHGDGVAKLPEQPDDLAEIARPPLFPDGVVGYRISNGVDLMPAWKNSLSPNEIWDLVNYIRSIPPKVD